MIWIDLVIFQFLGLQHKIGRVRALTIDISNASVAIEKCRHKGIIRLDKNILEAVCLTDVLSDGLSMVYSFFDPDKSKKSLGTFMILDHISVALDLGLPYLYLGYWVPGSQKMDYKVNFKGVEIFQNNKWRVLSENEEYKLDLHPLNTAPVSEQVSSLSLPDSTTT